MSCWDTVQAYAFRSLGYGERLLPRGEITLCEQVTLIGSGLIWNVYFGLVALLTGFVFAVTLAVGKNATRAWARKPAEWFIFVFRGSPLFIQFFLAYYALVNLPEEIGRYDISPPIRTRRSFFSTPPRWCSCRAFRPSGNRATRSITRSISRTGPSTPSSPTRSSRSISSS